jgi:transposase
MPEGIRRPCQVSEASTERLLSSFHIARFPWEQSRNVRCLAKHKCPVCAEWLYMELLSMTPSELNRIQTLQSIVDGGLSQVDAARKLGISERQVRRLVADFEKSGPPGVLSKRRGAAPNNRIDNAVRDKILERYKGDYHGFGPTFLAQTLAERDGIIVSRESLRALLIEHDLWQAKRRRWNVHPMRERRPCFGELVQMDGSPHDWFEDRGPRATLLLAIDDATSRVNAARLEPSETTDGYLRLMNSYLAIHGRFMAAYTDKHSIFRYSGPSPDTTVVTQFQRVLDELDIELICANSPQAKGRVERANRTFQDRFMKTLRLEAISTIDAANAYLPRFMAEHNEHFAIAPQREANVHRDVEGMDLYEILCRQDERVLTKNLMFQLDDESFMLTDHVSRRDLWSGSRIQIKRHMDGRMTVWHEGKRLEAESLGMRVRNAPIVEAKDLNAHMDKRIPNPRKAHKPAANHPWR